MSKLPKVKKGYQRLIIKFQKPLFVSEGMQGMALIYNEDRSFNTVIPYTEDLKAMFGDDDKMFYLCDLPMQTTGPIKMHRDVGEQGW